MIKKANELKFDDKKFTVIIAGVPGIGKTTLALSSPKPLLIDLDNGIGRVNARHRTDTDVVSSYEELIADLKSADLTQYESIVIDTGGKLLEMIKPVVIKEDMKNGKRDGNLSLQGYGAAKRKFQEFTKLVKSFGKNLIYVFHATEQKLADDTLGLRIRCEGGSKDEIWDDVDIGGFIEIVGKKRTIGFTNCDRYYAKGTYGVHGVYEIPELDENIKNDFLTQLFSKIKTQLNEENAEVSEYEKLMSENKPMIEASKHLEELNACYQKVKALNHKLTSKKELWFAITEKAKALGLKYDKESDRFIKVA